MTLLIKNVKILGGESRQSAANFDIFIQDKKISAIGNFPGKGADLVIDGQGAYLSPGFIDVNTDSDHYLTVFTNPEQQDFLRQGVTTIAGGHCGASLAPLIYGSLKSVQSWGDIGQINVNWKTIEEFLEILSGRSLGVNFLTLVGHSTVRRAITGGNSRDLTKNELSIFKALLKRSLDEGAFGLSTGPGYSHGKPIPYQEIKELASMTADQKLIYTTHLRNNADDLLAAVKETVKIAKETGVKTIINHFLPIRGFEKEYEAGFELIENEAKNLDLHFDLYPFEESILPLYTFLPAWAKKGDLETMASGLGDEWRRSKILKDLPEIDPEEFRVAQAIKHDYLVGHSLKELVEIFSLPTNEALLKLMKITNLKAVIFHKNINFELARQFIKSRFSFIASNSAAFKTGGSPKSLKPERSLRTFPRLLELSEKENLISLEGAIKKITVEPARKFDLKNRGQIKEGYFADLVIFKNSEIKHVIVNGRLVIKDGEFQGILAGRILRSND